MLTGQDHGKPGCGLAVKVRSYLRKYGVRLAVILVIVVFIALLSNGLRAGRANIVRDGTGSMTMPIKKAATAIVSWMEDLYNTMYHYDMLQEENEQLRAQLAELQEQARDYNEVFEENDRLHELLDFQDKHRDFVFETARIVSWDSSNYTSAFTISKGESSDIEVGDSVVTEYGALVGQVTETGSNWSTVRTVVDVNMDVGALVGTSGYAGMIVGEFSLMQEGLTRITYLAGGAQIFKEDVVLTSGAGGSFPAGLLIGHVVTVMSEAGGQTTYGIVEPECDLDALSHVYVIRDYDIVD